MQVRAAVMSVTAKFRTNKLAGTRRMALFVATDITTRELPLKASIELHIIGTAFPTDDNVTFEAVVSSILWRKLSN